MADVSFNIKENPGEEAIGIAKKALNQYNLQSEYGESIDKGSIFIAVDLDGKDVGSCLCHFRGNWLEIHTIWIVEEHRTKGIGTQIIQKLEELVKQKKLLGIMVPVTEFQSPEFYIKEGFEEFGRLENYAGKFARIYFKKDVKSD